MVEEFHIHVIIFCLCKKIMFFFLRIITIPKQLYSQLKIHITKYKNIFLIKYRLRSDA